MYILSSVSADNWNYREVIFLVCSQVYWLGDLNYRITELDPWLVKDYIDKGNYLPLLEYDQLHQQHGLKNVFAGYQEGDVTFRPTYKYDPGSDNWDSRYCISTLSWFCYTVELTKEVSCERFTGGQELWKPLVGNLIISYEIQILCIELFGLD